MSDHVYKKIELTGSSIKSADDAVKNAAADEYTASIRGKVLEVLGRGHEASEQ